jgi:hypothetical protein
MKSLVGIVFLVLIISVVAFAAFRLIRFVFGRASPKQKFDDANDIVDAAKVGLGMLAVATFVLAPVGLLAFLAGLKFVSVPTIVTIAPGLGLIFGGLAVMGSVAKIYSRRKLQRQTQLK